MNKTSGVYEWNMIAHHEPETKNAAWRLTGCGYQPEMTDIIQLSPEGEVNSGGYYTTIPRREGE